MKKVLMIAALAASVAVCAEAQNKYKPEGLSFSTELNYTFGGGTTDGALSLPEYGAKFRLFVNDAWAVRLNLGLSTVSDKTTTYAPNPDGGEYETYNKTATTRFSLMPGFEYHFNKFERISPYVGAEIGILTQNTKTTTTNDQNDNKTTVKQPGLGFGVNVVTGVDVYLCKGLYMGFELGLGYDSMNSKRGSTKVEAGGNTVETDGDRSTLDSFFGFHAQPQLRIGWHF